MRANYDWLTRARFYSRVTGLYLLTLLFALYLFKPSLIFDRSAGALPTTQIVQPPAPIAQVITGKPTRVVMPAIGVDLPVSEGYYNNVDQTWTLSDDQAYFAAPSMPPNDKQGNTLVYGHNTDKVFRATKDLQIGAELTLSTDNGHVFYYALESSEIVMPDNMNVFQYEGPPTLVIQTCSGNWSETRTLLRFKLVRITNAS